MWVSETAVYTHALQTWLHPGILAAYFAKLFAIKYTETQKNLTYIMREVDWMGNWPDEGFQMPLDGQKTHS